METRLKPTAHGRLQSFQIIEAALLAAAAALYALHFVHLRADFPNYSPWTDWAKYTDEGWYGLAAIRHYQLGHWNVPGDFNPAAALPIWPLLEMAVFRFTGVSLSAARALTVAIFGLILLCCYVLLRHWAKERGEESSLAPATAVLLLVANPFYFAFSRLAILEPLMILFALIALLVAGCAGDAAIAISEQRACGGKAQIGRGRTSSIAWLVALGIVIAAMVLTKTTGLFLVPAIAWMLWARCGRRVVVFLGAGTVSAAAAACAWGAYMLLFVRPRYLADYHYLFNANNYTSITKATLWPVVRQTLLSVGFVGAGIEWMGVAAVVWIVVRIASRRSSPDALPVSLLLWVFFYLAFLAYHDNLQARYYEAAGVPLTLLIAMAFDHLLQAVRRAETGNLSGTIRRIALRGAPGAAAAAILFTVALGAFEEISYIRHAQYTFVSALDQIRSFIESQRARDIAQGRPEHAEMVLSISGADLSLITGLPSICDDFGTMTLPDRIATYRPGWFLAWNDVEDDKMEALAPKYRLVRAGAWPAFDDPDRNLLILYRLDPVEQPGIGKGWNRRTRKIPRGLR